MAYEPVTVDDFYARFPSSAFPQFDNADDFVEVLLAEASTQVDETWRAEDYKPAILYLTAHKFTMQTGDQVDRPGDLTSERFGPFAFGYASGSKSKTSYDSTEFGREFSDLMRKNFPGVLQV